VTDFVLLNSQLRALLKDECDALASASNFVALINGAMNNINWIGIYVLRGDDLVLGPFQGKPACAHIASGDGVCGTAARSKRTQRIADVHQFDGHISCDADSRSELVVPLLIKDQLLGVLDIDSPMPNRFSAQDQAGVEKLCATFCELQQDRNAFI
jgi:GAF domain-containing protein